MPPAIDQVLTRKLCEHSDLSRDEIHALKALSGSVRSLDPREDIVRQGDEPQVSVIVLTGMVGRYHALPNGQRQYISFHIAGDMPDAQTLFLETMDHAVCAIDHVTIALVPHVQIISLFERRPKVGMAIWRETLIDAAIFREAVTNNSSRKPRPRLAHFLCEQFYRAQAAGLAKGGACSLPLSQTQLGETLGMSLVTVNRTLQSLRATGFVDLGDGRLKIHHWRKLAALGQFDPGYLHMKKPARR